MHMSYGSKCSTTNQAFQLAQEQCFLWENMTSFGLDFELYTFQTFYLHKMLHNSIKERQKPKKQNLTSLTVFHLLNLARSASRIASRVMEEP